MKNHNFNTCEPSYVVFKSRTKPAWVYVLCIIVKLVVYVIVNACAEYSTRFTARDHSSSAVTVIVYCTTAGTH